MARRLMEDLDDIDTGAGRLSESFNAFLNAYATVESELRSRAQAQPGEGLAGVIRALARDDRVVGQYQDDLLTFHELRNVIVHERRDNRPIAEPLPTAVESLERIAALLTQPPRVDKHFLADVQTCANSDPVGSVAGMMLNGNFSQVPVVDAGGISGLLTAGTIARWYAENLIGDLIEDATVEQAIQFTEDERHLKLIARDSTVIDALTLFDAALNDGYTIDAIVITHSGSGGEKPLGIITAFDVPRLHDTL